MICQTRRLPLSPGANKGIGFEIARQLGTQGAFTDKGYLVARRHRTSRVCAGAGRAGDRRKGRRSCGAGGISGDAAPSASTSPLAGSSGLPAMVVFARPETCLSR